MLSNEEMVDIVEAAPVQSSAAQALVTSAVRAWRYKYPTSKVDDCALVSLFLDPDSIKYQVIAPPSPKIGLLQQTSMKISQAFFNNEDQELAGEAMKYHRKKALKMFQRRLMRTHKKSSLLEGV